MYSTCIHFINKFNLIRLFYILRFYFSSHHLRLFNKVLKQKALIVEMFKFKVYNLYLTLDIHQTFITFLFIFIETHRMDVHTIKLNLMFYINIIVLFVWPIT